MALGSEVHRRKFWHDSSAVSRQVSPFMTPVVMIPDIAPFKELTVDHGSYEVEHGQVRAPNGTRSSFNRSVALFGGQTQ